MAIYGYTRCSTNQQSTERGEEEIRKFCEREKLDLIDIYTDSITGKDFENRVEYQFIKKRMIYGDCLIIPELDRLGRSRQGILDELNYYHKKGIRVMILEIPLTLQNANIDPNSDQALINNMITELVIQIYSTFSELETRKRYTRQAQSLALLKGTPEWENYGRPKAKLPEGFDKILKQINEGTLKPTEAYRQLGIKKSTFYKYRKLYEQQSQ